MRMIRRASLFLLLSLLCLLPSVTPAEESLAVTLPETVKGYTPCTIRILSPAEGEAELRLYDLLNNPWLTRREHLAEGENLLSWDGLAANRERLLAGPYHFDVVLKTAGGAEYTASAKFSISGTTPALVYALPSSDTLYLDKSERWFTECYVSAQCRVVMLVKDASGKTVYSKEMEMGDPEGETVRWAGVGNNRKTIPPGDYAVTFRSKQNPDYAVTFPLKAVAENPKSYAVTETGPIMPERGMSDGEIWDIMMKPSVVIDAKGSSLRFSLYRKPSSSSGEAASLRCATQALEIMGFEGAWARAAAWGHTDGQRAEGYILTRRLAVAYPNPRYGVLIDKRSQTLTVFENGERIGTVPVSTGLPAGRETYRETPAGSFLTDVHFGADFAQDGMRYEYPIRYDGGNMIHGLGYVRVGRVRDYSKNLPLLGQKASHGCVRVSLFAGEDSPINIYWLWTHLPWHTRVIVLDD